MKILLIGSSGQLGREIIKSSPNYIELLTPSKKEFNLSSPDECYRFILETSPNWVINSGAFTNVEKAEENKELALIINAKGPESIAKALSKTGGKLLHISTDYVFNGCQNIPYKTNQVICPINSYGFSKAKGEEYIQKLLPDSNKLCIIRTSWLMGAAGNNFANKMIQLINSLDEIKVVYDQISSPTITNSLANAIWRIIKINDLYTQKNRIFPRLNLFSNSGIASWYDVAVAISEIGLQTGLIKKTSKIIPVESYEYPTIAARPKYSVLESNQTKKIININNIHWRKALVDSFQSFKNTNSN